ncbi:MAG: glycosyltransferase family 4 protein [Myxococcaceae bacterium]
MSARWSSRDQDGLWTEAGVGRILEALRPQFEEVHVGLALSPEKLQLHDHLLPPGRFEIHSLPWLPSVVGGITKGRDCRKVIAEIEQRCDVVVVQLPFAAPTGLLPARKPRVYHLCADIVEIVRSSTYYRGPKRIAAVGLARGIDQLEHWLMRRPNARHVANGRELHRMFGGDSRGSVVVSATLLDRDVMSVPRQRPPEAPFRILFVGYLRHEKGIGVLLDACKRLAGRTSRKLELVVVGAQHSEDRGVTADVQRGLKALEGSVDVRFEGHLPFGPKLFQAYADADVLALPSLSEGTPRVLVEARAFGCTVVASRVGGIPSSVEHEADGLLVPPGEPEALAGALLRVADDAALRRRLVEAGIATARRHTVEAMAGVIATEAKRAAGRG